MTTNQSTGTPRYDYAQRTAGYAVNDGRWVAQRIAPLHWSNIGTLQQTGASKFLGIFDTLAAAEAAAAADLADWANEPKPIHAVR